MSGTNSNMVAEYWKNKSVFRLTDGSNNARSKSISVDGPNVYVAGAEYLDGSHYAAKYWMNGVAMIITDHSNYSMANSIAVWYDGIYLAGKQLKGSLLQGTPEALYWKDGDENPVMDPYPSSGWANSVFLTGNNSRKEAKIYGAGDQNKTGVGTAVLNVISGICSFLVKNSGSSSNYYNRSVSAHTSSSTNHSSNSLNNNNQILKR